MFSVVEGNVSPLSGADADGILDGDDEDTSVAYLAGLCSLDDGFYGLLGILVAYDDGDEDTTMTPLDSLK